MILHNICIIFWKAEGQIMKSYAKCPDPGRISWSPRTSPHKKTSWVYTFTLCLVMCYGIYQSIMKNRTQNIDMKRLNSPRKKSDLSRASAAIWRFSVFRPGPNNNDSMQNMKNGPTEQTKKNCVICHMPLQPYSSVAYSGRARIS